MKTRNRILALLILDTAVLVLATVVNSAAMAALDEDASNNGITAAPKDIKSLRITVVDVNHKPIEGAKIRQNQVHKPPMPPSPSKRTAIKNQVYVTDKTGSTTITWPGESVDLRIWASKPGYVPLHAFWIKKFQSDGGQIPNEFKFVMKAGTKIGGVVKDEDGKPVEGATVEIFNHAGSLYSRVTEESLGKPGRRPVPVIRLAEGDSAITTDSNGRGRKGDILLCRNVECPLFFSDRTTLRTNRRPIAAPGEGVTRRGVGGSRLVWLRIKEPLGKFERERKEKRKAVLSAKNL